MEIIQTLLLLLILAGVYMQSGLSLLRKNRHRILIDSCGLIDGRIVDLVRSGFLRDSLIVPTFIISELQTLADGKDAHTRERARHGLDAAHQLQLVAGDKVELLELHGEGKQVDDNLIRMAQKYGAALYTTDVALAKRAAVYGIEHININNLSATIRPSILPGEQFEVKLMQKGNGPNQAIGYTDDGAMIVVDNAVRFVGKSVPVVCERIHQTVAGKMLFATLARQSGSSDEPPLQRRLRGKT